MSEDTATGILLLMIVAFILGYVLGHARGKLSILDRQHKSRNGDGD